MNPSIARLLGKGVTMLEVEKKYFSVKEIAELLSISEKTVRKYVWLRTIPYLKICGHVRFDVQKIQKWLGECEVPTYDEIRYGRSSRKKQP